MQGYAIGCYSYNTNWRFTPLIQGVSKPTFFLNLRDPFSPLVQVRLNFVHSSILNLNQTVIVIYLWLILFYLCPYIGAADQLQSKHLFK